ncbi:hypothetical protein [Piscinibacter defluvii]|uniref:hypothetical protein n=1 Tax=Piscinibacter defluvii TaxID=1796922 RepID=UPI00197C7D28|nr:hypothetical protein [Piscinibacter defluvii]
MGTIGANSRGGTSLSLMSGGERTFIDACLTRAIALYLAQNTGRRFDTLFSDEADGPLDPEHKRMLMNMKREVLRLGGYQQEFFITQAPHLATMADAIIDLDAMQADAQSADALVAERAHRWVQSVHLEHRRAPHRYSSCCAQNVHDARKTNAQMRSPYISARPGTTPQT